MTFALRDDEITRLQRELEDIRFAKERLTNEAVQRIGQYETRLQQMQGESDYARREADELREDRDRLQGSLVDAKLYVVILHLIVIENENFCFV